MSKCKKIQAGRRWLCALSGAISLLAPAVAAHAAERGAEARPYAVVASSQLLQEARPDGRSAVQVFGRDAEADAAGEERGPVIPSPAAARTLVSLALWLAIGAVRPASRKRSRQS
jgi:hypothetical protein